MAATRSFVRLPLVVLFAGLFVALSSAALANESAAHAAPAKPRAAPEAAARAPDAAAPAPATTSTERKPRAAPPQSLDPLDAVRERLAAKLGATRPPDSPNPNVLRVTTKAIDAPGSHAAQVATAALAPPGAPVRRAAQRAAPMTVPSMDVPRTTPDHASMGHPSHWDYAGQGGPETWGQMKPEFATCSSGKRQSPIDIRDGIKVNLDPVQFDYRPTGFRVIDNGHTVQVNVGAGNSIEVMGRRYELLQFHFHRPSEERINGKQFDMVAHLVHKDPDGKLAVVAVLLERGGAQSVVQTVWNNLPLEKGEEVAARAPLDLNALLPTDRSYFTYMGSLTTPPCSEGVLWMVMRTPMPISPDQVGIFARLYPMNARPIQSASGRLIKESE